MVILVVQVAELVLILQVVVMVIRHQLHHLKETLVVLVLHHRIMVQAAAVLEMLVRMDDPHMATVVVTVFKSQSLDLLLPRRVLVH
tara:strand:+ start:23 stop:280 length:258 start_codon:yes stop_codon:yes gene_type:complete